MLNRELVVPPPKVASPLVAMLVVLAVLTGIVVGFTALVRAHTHKKCACGSAERFTPRARA